MPMDSDRASKMVGVAPLIEARTDNVMNVPLSDPRLVKAGIDPKSLIGKGITERELQSRLAKAKGKN